MCRCQIGISSENCQPRIICIHIQNLNFKYQNIKIYIFRNMFTGCCRWTSSNRESSFWRILCRLAWTYCPAGITSHQNNFYLVFQSQLWSPKLEHIAQQVTTDQSSKWFQFPKFQKQLWSPKLKHIAQQVKSHQSDLDFFNSNHNDHGHHQSLNYLAVNYKNISP